MTPRRGKPKVNEGQYETPTKNANCQHESSIPRDDVEDMPQDGHKRNTLPRRCERKGGAEEVVEVSSLIDSLHRRYETVSTTEGAPKSEPNTSVSHCEVVQDGYLDEEKF